MICPRCNSDQTIRRRRRTSLGYRSFACRACRSIFNERTGTPFNDLQYPTDVVLLAALWRLGYKLSFRDVAELLLERGFEVTHEKSDLSQCAGRSRAVLSCSLNDRDASSRVVV